MPKNLKSTRLDQKNSNNGQNLSDKKTNIDQSLPVDENLLNKMSPLSKKEQKKQESIKKPVNVITGYYDDGFRPESILEEKFEKVLAERKEKFIAERAARGKAGPLPPIDPKELGEEYYDKIRKLASKGLSQKQIAAYLGMSDAAWYQKCHLYPELRIAVKQGCAIAIEVLAANAYQRAINGDTTLSVFLLKTVGKYSEHWKQDVNGDDEPATPSLSITVTDPIEAMQQYERIMKG